MSEAVDTAGGPEPFVAKWRGHWPEWSIAEAFLPASQRPLAVAWEALQFELQEAAWGGVDARPGEAKLGWWMEELGGWAQGRRRHPLGGVLQRAGSGWGGLGRALPELAATRERPLSAAEAWSALQAPAAAVADIDAALFGGTGDVPTVTATWLHARLARHGAAAAPLESLAAGGSDAAVAWRDRLLAQWPDAPAGGRPRRLLAGLARARLRQGDAARPLRAWTSLHASWRAARD